MAQKIIRIGSSHGVTVRKSLLEQAGIKPGAEVIVDYDDQLGCIRIQSPAQKDLARALVAAEKLVAQNTDELMKLSDE